MGKMRFFNLFYKNKSIRMYLPPTSFLTKNTLEEFLTTYDAVYIKPNSGARGNGVTKVWKEKNGYALVRERGKVKFYSNIASLYQQLKLYLKEKYVIQMAIPLAEVNGRPFDIRLMMMRDELGKWTDVGMLAKVAGDRSIITNLIRGKGYALEVDEALKSSLHLRPNQIDAIKREIINLGYECSWTYDKYQYDWQIGYDIGVDKNGRVWLIEANPTYPSHKLFTNIPDQSMYKRIKKLALENKNKKMLEDQKKTLMK